MSHFAEAIKHFNALTAQEAQEKIDSGEKFILFIGRSTCPYCQRFAPKLSQVAADTGQTVAFLNSENQDSDTQELRTTYDVPTVPGLLVAKSGHVKVVCDSSLSEEAILDFITH